MLKREREDASDRMTGRSNGFKVQRTSEQPERSATEPVQTGSQDVVSGISRRSLMFKSCGSLKIEGTRSHNVAADSVTSLPFTK